MDEKGMIIDISNTIILCQDGPIMLWEPASFGNGTPREYIAPASQNLSEIKVILFLEIFLIESSCKGIIWMSRFYEQ